MKVPVVVKEVVEMTDEANMGSESVFACSIISGWESSQDDITSKVSEPVCPLMNGKLQDIMCATENVSRQKMSVARLSVSVDQLSSSDVCTVKGIKCPDDIICVDGEMSVNQYVCTVCTKQPLGCRCVDSMGSDANQKGRIRCSVNLNQTRDSLPTDGGGTQASGTSSFINNITINGRGDRMTIPAMFRQSNISSRQKSTKTVKINKHI